MTMTKASKSRYFGSRHAAGVGLIEVLIAVVILAFGMLGVAALQAASLRNGESALERSLATAESYAILDAMRANLAFARIHAYDITKTCTVPAAGSTLASNDLHEWLTSLKGRLGSNVTTCGEITCGSLDCKITVYWDDSHGTFEKSSGNGQANAAANNVVTRTRL